MSVILIIKFRYWYNALIGELESKFFSALDGLSENYKANLLQIHRCQLVNRALGSMGSKRLFDTSILLPPSLIRCFEEYEANPSVMQALNVIISQSGQVPSSSQHLESLMHERAMQMQSLKKFAKHMYDAKHLRPSLYVFQQDLIYSKAVFYLCSKISGFSQKELFLGVVSAHQNVANVLADLSEIKRAYAHYEEAIRICKIHFPGSRYLANNVSYSSDMLNELGEYQKALLGYKKALGLYQKLDPSCKEVGMTLKDMGVVYKYLGRYEEAMSSYQKALLISRKENPSGSFDVAITIRCIANIYKKQGNLQTALKYFKQSVKILRKVAPESTMLAETYVHMGHVYVHQKEYKKSIALYQKALAIQQSIAPASLTEATIWSSMGISHRLQGQIAQAMDAQNRAHDILSQRAPNGPDMTAVRSELAQLQEGMRSLLPNGAENSLQDYKSLLHTIDQKGGKGDDAATTLANMARIEWKIGSKNEALEHAKLAVKRAQDALGSMSWKANTHQAEYGNYLWQAERYDEALVVLKEVYQHDWALMNGAHSFDSSKYDFFDFSAHSALLSKLKAYEKQTGRLHDSLDRYEKEGEYMLAKGRLLLALYYFKEARKCALEAKNKAGEKAIRRKIADVHHAIGHVSYAHALYQSLGERRNAVKITDHQKALETLHVAFINALLSMHKHLGDNSSSMLSPNEARMGSFFISFLSLLDRVVHQWVTGLNPGVKMALFPNHGSDAELESWARALGVWHEPSRGQAGINQQVDVFQAFLRTQPFPYHKKTDAFSGMGWGESLYLLSNINKHVKVTVQSVDDKLIVKQFGSFSCMQAAILVEIPSVRITPWVFEPIIGLDRSEQLSAFLLAKGVLQETAIQPQHKVFENLLTIHANFDQKAIKRARTKIKELLSQSTIEMTSKETKYISMFLVHQVFMILGLQTDGFFKVPLIRMMEQAFVDVGMWLQHFSGKRGRLQRTFPMIHRPNVQGITWSSGIAEHTPFTSDINKQLSDCQRDAKWLAGAKDVLHTIELQQYRISHMLIRLRGILEQSLFQCIYSAPRLI